MRDNKSNMPLCVAQQLPQCPAYAANAEALLQILNNLDANVYVTDIQSGEILFMNHKMCADFGVTGCEKDRICGKGAQRDFGQQNPYGPAAQMQQGESYVWEQYNILTNKYYRNTDCIIQWDNNKLAHMRCSVDITQVKTELQSAQQAGKTAELAGEWLEGEIRKEPVKTDTVQLLEGYTVLAAEDVEINREILYSQLEPTKLKIDFVVNGLAAVERIQKYPDRYDLILMDIHMPVMDGYEATAAIRSLDISCAKTIPIVAMSASAVQDDIDKSRSCGMNEHIAKPVDVEKLYNVVYSYLLNGRSVPNMLEKEMASTPEVSSAGELETYVNTKEALGRLRNNEKLYATLLQSFAQNTFYPQLCTEVENKDLTAAASTAHAIKGMAANLSLNAVYEVVAQLEGQLKNNQPYEESFEKLKQVYEKTSTYIQDVMATLKK